MLHAGGLVRLDWTSSSRARAKSPSNTPRIPRSCLCLLIVKQLKLIDIFGKAANKHVFAWWS